MAKRNSSRIGLPATTCFGSYHLKASGLSLSRPSKRICPMPGEYSLSPLTMFIECVSGVLRHLALELSLPARVGFGVRGVGRRLDRLDFRERGKGFRQRGVDASAHAGSA